MNTYCAVLFLQESRHNAAYMAAGMLLQDGGVGVRRHGVVCVRKGRGASVSVILFVFITLHYIISCLFV
jgi:hypothetical protein